MFVDIGANLGFYSLLFAHYGYDVLAIEPMRHNVRLINMSLCFSPELRARVTVVNAALASPADDARAASRGET